MPVTSKQQLPAFQNNWHWKTYASPHANYSAESHCVRNRNTEKFGFIIARFCFCKNQHNRSFVSSRFEISFPHCSFHFSHAMIIPHRGSEGCPLNNIDLSQQFFFGVQKVYWHSFFLFTFDFYSFSLEHIQNWFWMHLTSEPCTSTRMLHIMYLITTNNIHLIFSSWKTCFVFSKK